MNKKVHLYLNVYLKRQYYMNYQVIIFLELLTEQSINDYIKQKMTLEDYNLSLNDLYYLSYLGRGRFGNVCLVHNEIFFYVIKAISKLTVKRQKFGFKYILYEKNKFNYLKLIKH